MRKKRDYSYLPIEKQIEKLKFRIKVICIYDFISILSIIILSFLLMKFTSEWKLGIALIVTLPLGIFIEGFRIREYRKEITDLQKKLEVK